jgi:hypothetical protein
MHSKMPSRVVRIGHTILEYSLMCLMWMTLPGIFKCFTIYCSSVLSVNKSKQPKDPGLPSQPWQTYALEYD